MKHYTALTLTLATACLSNSMPVAAADTELEEVTVYGTQLEETIPQMLEQYGNQLEIISAEQIRDGAFTDIADALRLLVPGLHISPKNGPFDYFRASLHGARNQDILWLVDGVRITNRLYNGTSPLDTLPPNIVERIEVLKGGQGIFYGTQSVGGVVNIVTRQFSEELQGEVGLGASSNNGQKYSGSVSGSVGDHQFVLHASRDDADGYTPYDKEAIEPSATDTERGYTVNTAGIKYGWAPSDKVWLSGHYQYSDADLDYARPFLNKSTTNARKESLATVKLDIVLSDQARLFTKAYYHSWDTDYTRIYNELDSSGALTGGIVVRNNKTYWGYKDYGFSTMLEWQVAEPVEMVFGFDQQNYSAEDDVWRIADQKERVNALFVQLRSDEDFSEHTRFSFGVRNNRPSKSRNSTVWNVTARHDISDNWYVLSNIGTSFRLPDAEALFLNEYDDLDNDGVPDGGWFAIGNPDLKPESSRNYNLSVGYNGSSLQSELTLFKRDIKDYIASYIPIVINGVEGETFANSDDEVNIRGAELQLSASLTESVSLTGSFNYNRALFNDRGDQLKSIPRREAKGSLKYQPVGKRWDAQINVLYVGDVNDREVRPAYTIADISAGLILDSAGHHKLTMRLENIADKKYATSMGRGTRDSGDKYVYRNLGMERTLHLAYRYTF